MNRTFEIMPRKADAEFPEFQSSIYEPVGGLHNLICEVYVDSEAEYIKRCLNGHDDLLAALREIEAHHVEQNRIKGRDESHSRTLRIARAAIAKAGQP